jgi:hypothetical protein
VGVGVGVALGWAQYLPPVLSKVWGSPPLQIIISSPVQTAVWPDRAEGALSMLVPVQLSVLGLYLPPVLKILCKSVPPQTIISLPVQTAVWPDRTEGASVVLVPVQLSVPGSYTPPVFK